MFSIIKDVSQMKNKIFFIFSLLFLWQPAAQALQERHLIIIHHAEGEHSITGIAHSNPKHPDYQDSRLTAKGKEQAQNTAERLVLHGFDNRNIAAVFVSPLPSAQETAEIISDFGIFPREKIIIDDRLIDAQAGDLEGEALEGHIKDLWHVSQEEVKKYDLETNFQVRTRMMQVYDQAQKQYPEGHIVFITHGTPAMELLQDIIQIEVRLNPAEAYVLPLIARKSQNTTSNIVASFDSAEQVG